MTTELTDTGGPPSTARPLKQWPATFQNMFIDLAASSSTDGMLDLLEHLLLMDRYPDAESLHVIFMRLLNTADETDHAADKQASILFDANMSDCVMHDPEAMHQDRTTSAQWTWQSLTRLGHVLERMVDMYGPTVMLAWLYYDSSDSESNARGRRAQNALHPDFPQPDVLQTPFWQYIETAFALATETGSPLQQERGLVYLHFILTLLEADTSKHQRVRSLDEKGLAQPSRNAEEMANAILVQEMNHVAYATARNKSGAIVDLLLLPFLEQPERAIRLQVLCSRFWSLILRIAVSSSAFDLEIMIPLVTTAMHGPKIPFDAFQLLLNVPLALYFDQTTSLRLFQQLLPPTLVFLISFRYLVDYAPLTKEAKQALPDFTLSALRNAPLAALMPMTELSSLNHKQKEWVPPLLYHYYRGLRQHIQSPFHLNANTSSTRADRDALGRAREDAQALFTRSSDVYKVLDAWYNELA